MLAVRQAEAQGHERVVLDARVVKGSGGGPDKTILNSPRCAMSCRCSDLQ